MILTALAVVAVFGTSCHTDFAYKNKYMRNKVTLLTALIENYKSEKGSLPRTLNELASPYDAYLRANPEIEREYLNTQWSPHKPGISEVAPGYEIQYYPLPDVGYFLCGVTGEASHAETLEKLKNGNYGDYLNKSPKQRIHVVAHDGSILYSLINYDEQYPLPVTMENLTKIMVKYKYAGPTP